MGRFMRMSSCSCLIYTMLLSPVSVASIPTRTLDWCTDSLVEGLLRLKDKFLDTSKRSDTEFVGAVLQDSSGRYRFTVGNGKPGQDTVTFQVRYPQTQELVGFWHTHGDQGPNRDRFSRADVELVRNTGKPFFLITADGRLLVLTPEAAQGSGGLFSDQGSGRSRAVRGSRAGIPVLSSL